MQERAQSSYLFTLRLWRADDSETQAEWQGRIQYIYSNESHDFRNWSELVALLQQAGSEFVRQSGAEGKFPPR